MRDFIKLVEGIHDDGVIRIGSNPAKEKVMAAIEEWNSLTHEHPLNRSARLTDGASVEVSYFDGALHLSDVMAIGVPRKGGGTQAVKLLCDLADKHGVKITLTAKAYTDGHMSTDQLKSWYERFGFQEEEDSFGDEEEGYDMVRYPR